MESNLGVVSSLKVITSLKWTGLVKSQVDGPKDWNWAVMYQTRRSKRLKVDGPEIRSLSSWTVYFGSNDRPL